MDSCPKANFKLPIIKQELLKRGYRFYRGFQVEGGGYVQNSTVSADDHLEVIHVVI